MAELLAGSDIKEGVEYAAKWVDDVRKAGKLVPVLDRREDTCAFAHQLGVQMRLRLGRAWVYGSVEEDEELCGVWESTSGSGSESGSGSSTAWSARHTLSLKESGQVDVCTECA
jgi:hypothetical protein